MSRRAARWLSSVQLEKDVLEREALDLEVRVEVCRDRGGAVARPMGCGDGRARAVYAARERVGNTEIPRQRAAPVNVQPDDGFLERVEIAGPREAAVLDDPDLVRGALEIRDDVRREQHRALRAARTIDDLCNELAARDRIEAPGRRPRRQQRPRRAASG